MFPSFDESSRGAGSKQRAVYMASKGLPFSLSVKSWALDKDSSANFLNPLLLSCVKILLHFRIWLRADVQQIERPQVSRDRLLSALVSLARNHWKICYTQHLSGPKRLSLYSSTFQKRQNSLQFIIEPLIENMPTETHPRIVSLNSSEEHIWLGLILQWDFAPFKTWTYLFDVLLWS